MAKTIFFYSLGLALVGTAFCQTTAPTYGQVITSFDRLE